MNHENVSQIFFEDSYTVPAEQTARALFARLPHGCGYADRMVECLATGYLVAVIESICIGRIQDHIRPDDEVVVGLRVHLEHRRPMPTAARITLRGWVAALSQRSVTFRVRAHDAQELVCEAVVTLVVLPRMQMEARIDAKRALIPDDMQRARTGVAQLTMAMSGVPGDSRPPLASMGVAARDEAPIVVQAGGDPAGPSSNDATPIPMGTSG